jgi:SAM-dependent methyltransferase
LLMDSISVFDSFADKYDRWFDENEKIYEAEVNALRQLIPRDGVGVEIGVGTGRFSTPFGIEIGVEPSIKMAELAKVRNISVLQAVGEQLPFRDRVFDFALLVNVVCFVKDAAQLLLEVGRVVKAGGKIVIGFIDKDSVLGKLYESKKEVDEFYKVARFYSVPEIVTLVRQAGFGGIQLYQTLIGYPKNNNESAYLVRAGYGEGGFVVLGATRLEGYDV